MIYFVSRHQGAVEWIQHQTEWKVDCFLPHLDTAKVEAGGDLCKKAFPPTAETQTQVFVYFRP